MRETVLLALGSAVLAFSACGGSGGDTPVDSFPLQSGYRALIAAGSATNFSVSGTCSGTARVSSAAAAPATFEGVAGYAVAETLTASFTNCTPASMASSGTQYFDASYKPLGSTTTGEYASFSSPPSSLPASVRVGDTATYGTLTLFADSRKATVVGTRVLSYVVEPDSASSAVVNFIAKRYNASNQLLTTEQDRYRILADGSLTLMSIDLQFSTTSTTHLLLTRQ